jgi:hypothetical protein
MGKNRSTDKAHRAMQQKIQAGMAVVTQGSVLAQPSKAELRAMVPPYDESMVKRIPPNVKGKKPGGATKG